MSYYYIEDEYYYYIRHTNNDIRIPLQKKWGEYELSENGVKSIIRELNLNDSNLILDRSG